MKLLHLIICFMLTSVVFAKPVEKHDVKNEVAGVSSIGSSNLEEKPSNVKRTVITYDQRQEGKLNVRADLENFVIVFVPSTPSQGMSLLEMLATMKRNQAKNSNKRYSQKIHAEKDLNTVTIQHEGKPDKESDLTARVVDHFIEGRTPYKVDISSSLSHLHPENTYETKETGIIANADSPVLRLIRPNESNNNNLINRKKRSLNQFHPSNEISSNSVVALKNTHLSTFGDGDLYNVPAVVHIDRPISSAYLKDLTDSIPSFDSLDLDLDTDAKYVDDNWKLLGATEPGCGPDMKRDSYGICRYYPKFV